MKQRAKINKHSLLKQKGKKKRFQASEWYWYRMTASAR